MAHMIAPVRKVYIWPLFLLTYGEDQWAKSDQKSTQ